MTDPVRDAREAHQKMREAMLAWADAVAKVIDGADLVLIDADHALDQARRLAFACYFDGKTFEDQADALDCDVTSRQIATVLEGLTPAQAVHVLEYVRWACWQRRYQGAPAAPGGELH